MAIIKILTAEVYEYSVYLTFGHPSLVMLDLPQNGHHCNES